MRSGVGELKRPRHITCGVNVGVNGLQVFVGLDGAVRGNAQVFQAITLQPRHAAHRAQQLVKHDALFCASVSHHQHLFAIRHLAAQRFVPGEHLYAVGLE